MSEYEGIMSGIAQKVYQRYLEKEKKIEEKQSKEREKRKTDLVSREKKISRLAEKERLRRRQRRS